MSDNQLEFHLPAPPVIGDTPLVPVRTGEYRQEFLENRTTSDRHIVG